MNDLSRSASPILPAPITTEDYSTLIQSILPQPSSSSSSSFIPNAINNSQSCRGFTVPHNRLYVSGRSVKPFPNLVGQSETQSSSQSGSNSKQVRHKVPFREALIAPSDDDSGCAVDEVTWSANDFQPQVLGKEAMMIITMRQLPPQDFDENFCRSMTESEKLEMKLFNLKRKTENIGKGKVEIVTHGRTARKNNRNVNPGGCVPGLGLPTTSRLCAPVSFDEETQAVKCFKCGRDLYEGELSIKAERAGLDLFWHPSCFVCCQCEEILVDWIYFHYEGLIYCGRHHAEQIKPRCYACDEIIFADECTEAESKSWHVGHFTCQSCHIQLGGKRYVVVGGTPFCCPCFDRLAPEGQVCSVCGLVIGHEDGHVICDSDQWHSRESCFKCSECNRSLLEQKFYYEDSKLFCCFCYNSSTNQQLRRSNSEVRPQPMTSNLNELCSSADVSLGNGKNISRLETSIVGEDGLVSSIQSDASLEEKLMFASVLSSESEVYSKQIVNEKRHLQLSISTSKSTSNVQDDISKQLIASIHSYKNFLCANNDIQNSCNNNDNTNNNHNYLNYLSSLSSINLYEKLRNESGSDRSSLRLYETILNEVEMKQSTDGKNWMEAVRSGSWIVSDGYGSDVEKWLDRCRVEKTEQRNVASNEEAMRFTFKILNRFPFSDKNQTTHTRSSERKAFHLKDPTEYSAINDSNDIEAVLKAQCERESAKSGIVHSVSSAKNKSTPEKNLLKTGKIGVENKKCLQTSKARRWSRLRVGGYSSDSGKKRKKWIDGWMDGWLDERVRGSDDGLFYAELEQVERMSRKNQHNESKRVQAAHRYYQRHKSRLSSDDEDDEDGVAKTKSENCKMLNNNTYDKVFDGEDDDSNDKDDSISSSNDDDDDDNDKQDFYHELCSNGYALNSPKKQSKENKMVTGSFLKLKPPSSIKHTICKSRCNGTDTKADSSGHIVYQNLYFKNGKHLTQENATVFGDVKRVKNNISTPPQPRLGIGRIEAPGYHRSLLANFSPLRHKRRIERSMDLYGPSIGGYFWNDLQSEEKMGTSLRERGSKLIWNRSSGMKKSNEHVKLHHHKSRIRHGRPHHRHRRHHRLHQHWRDWYSTCGSSSSCTSDGDDCDLMTSCAYLITSSSTSSSEFDYYLEEEQATSYANGGKQNGRPNMASTASVQVGSSSLAGSRMMTGNGSTLTTCFSSINRFKNRNRFLYVTSERCEKRKEKDIYPKQCIIS